MVDPVLKAIMIAKQRRIFGPVKVDTHRTIARFELRTSPNHEVVIHCKPPSEAYATSISFGALQKSLRGSGYKPVKKSTASWRIERALIHRGSPVASIYGHREQHGIDADFVHIDSEHVERIFPILFGPGKTSLPVVRRAKTPLPTEHQ